MVSLDCGNAAMYVLMSCIYMHAGMHDDAQMIEGLRKCANRWKKPAKCFIEIDNQVHQFIVGDKRHPRSADIYAKLQTLSVKMREAGYKPNLDLVLDPISDEDKEAVLCGHSEKLAIAFGLICTPRGATIRVSKNLRMCANCHTAAEILSKVERREILVIDTYCIHHFQDGECSCKNYYESR